MNVVKSLNHGLILGLLVSSCTFSPQKQEHQQLVEKARRGSLTIVVSKAETPSSLFIGGGFYLGENKIATAAHVTNHAGSGPEDIQCIPLVSRTKGFYISKSELTQLKEKKWACKVLQIFRNQDLSILEFTESPDVSQLSTLKISNKPLKRSDKVFGFSTTTGFAMTWLEGYIANEIDMTPAQWTDDMPETSASSVYLFSSPVRKGSSGMPMLNEHGDLIGMLKGMTTEHHFGIITPVNSFKSYL